LDFQKNLKRIALGLEYEGTHYHGWQYQTNGISIQEKLESALSKVANHPVTTITAGRTDAGVHALGQVVHFDTTSERVDAAWVMGTNMFLPKDIRVHWSKEVPADFDARHRAIARSYRYVIYCNRVSPGIHQKGVTWVHYDLLNEQAIDHMAQAARCFIGEHDFSSFRASGCQSKTPYRRIIEITVKKVGSCIFIDITGNAFLHHMVRNMAGVLIAIGRGHKPVAWAQEVLLAQDRRYAGITAPPCGLYLMNIHYPEHFNLPLERGNAWFFNENRL